MATNKYTAAQLRKAREVIDQEEAIEYERERRAKLREARSDSEGRVSYTPKPTDPRLTRALTAIAVGLFVMWAINGYFRLYAISAEDSVYRRFIWLPPLMWICWVSIWYFSAPNTKPLTKDERRWAKQYKDWSEGRRAAAPRPLSAAPPSKPRKGNGEWFTIKEKKDSGQ